MQNPLSVLLRVTQAFDQLGISYFLVGSMASSAHGMYRASGDIDIVARITEEHVRRLVDSLTSDFYIDDLAIRRALANHKSFNVFHLETVFKVDIFVAKVDPFTAKQFERCELMEIAPEVKQQVYVATAEDTILAKLVWYRKGEEVSAIQWLDVLGVMSARHKDLDIEYLNQWADWLGVHDLLERALGEAR